MDYPYARIDLNAQASAWALAGAGSGSITLTQDGGDPMKTDLSMRMGALGVNNRVLDGSGLWGVGLTRARRQVFLLAEGGAPSAFATELIDERIGVTVFGRPPEGDVPCPQCREGRLERRENTRDGSVFYGCSNWPYCEQTGRSCPKCGTGLPVRSGSTFRCSDCGGRSKGVRSAAAGWKRGWDGSAAS